MGATAGLLSLPTGYVLALVLVYVINLRSFGWTIQMHARPAGIRAGRGHQHCWRRCWRPSIPCGGCCGLPIAAALRQE